jgi:methyl-accepting chemotaxis protein
MTRDTTETEDEAMAAVTTTEALGEPMDDLTEQMAALTEQMGAVADGLAAFDESSQRLAGASPTTAVGARAADD